MRNSSLLFSATFVLVFVVAATLPDLAAACPNCKDGLGGNQASQAFAISILFMMSMPFILGAAWIAAIIKLRKSYTQSLV